MSESFKDGGENKLSGAQAAEFIQKLANSWEFDGKTEQENTRFLYHLAKFTCFLAGDRTKDTYASGSGLVSGAARVHFDGEKAPEPLKTMLAIETQDGFSYTQENVLSIAENPQYVFEEPFIPNWDELSQMPYSQMYHKIISTPSLLDQIEIPKIVITDMLQIKFEAGDIRHWGLKFKSTPSALDASVFGNEDCTWAASELLVEYSQNKSQMCKMASGLITILAKNLLYSKEPTITYDDMQQFSLWYNGLANPPYDLRKIHPPRGIKGLVMNQLLEDGYIDG